MSLVMPNPLTHETFSEFVRTHRLVVVHFWAAWNGVDHLMHKLLETQLPEEVRRQAVFASLDMDPQAHHQLGVQHKVLNLPFLAFYRDGTFVRGMTGMQKSEVIATYLRELANEAAN